MVRTGNVVKLYVIVIKIDAIREAGLCQFILGFVKVKGEVSRIREVGTEAAFITQHVSGNSQTFISNQGNGFFVSGIVQCLTESFIVQRFHGSVNRYVRSMRRTDKS